MSDYFAGDNRSMRERRLGELGEGSQISPLLYVHDGKSLTAGERTFIDYSSALDAAP